MQVWLWNELLITGLGVQYFLQTFPSKREESLIAVAHHSRYLSKEVEALLRDLNLER
jgi:hypothetical protein